MTIGAFKTEPRPAPTGRTAHPWLTRAFDPYSPTYAEEYFDTPSAIKTISVYRPELGGEILFPTIREIGGTLRKLSDEEALKKALEQKDYILFEGPPEEANRLAIEMAQRISESIVPVRRENAARPRRMTPDDYPGGGRQ